MKDQRAIQTRDIAKAGTKSQRERKIRNCARKDTTVLYATNARVSDRVAIIPVLILTPPRVYSYHMKPFLLLIPAALISCAATYAPAYRSLLDEAPPTRLPVPVAGVKASKLYDSWGDARSEGRSHEGIDIMAKRGTPVLSTTHGIVRSVEWRDRGGNTVSVLGPAGYSHYYAHLDSYGRFVEGDQVSIGDTLGFVGNTGNASGGAPHLHYGIYTRDGAINPYPLLTGKASTTSATGGAVEEKRSDSVSAGQKKSSRTRKRSATVKEQSGGPSVNGPATARRRR
jgi:murein DD-endopeptidase MepM/ murein hydrolase activator NlpD